MERKIQWNSGCFDEIDLVYGKAAEKEVTEKILSELEVGALAEARAYSDKIVVDGRPLTPQQFDALPDSTKEQVMYNLSGMGLSAFSAPLTAPKISVRLSPHIQFVRCCTAFSILNRLEKLDGAFNMLHPQATLEIQAPLGGKKGLVHIEMLISFLYPWLKVTEISSNEIAVQPVQEQPKPKQEPNETKATVATSAPVQAATACEAKPSFWERLFGKKNKNTTNVTPVVPAKPEVNAQPVFIRTPDQLWVFHSANSNILSEEVYQAIISKFQELRDKVIGKGGETDVRWSEFAIMISLYDEDSHWVGHDDTVTESIELKLERLSKWEEPSEWTSESDLPCEGAYQYLNKSKNEGDSWSYSVMSHKAWLLKSPFGLPGVWSFEYISKRDR